MKNQTPARSVQTRRLLLLVAGSLFVSLFVSLAPTAEAQTFTPTLTLTVKSAPSAALAINGAPQPVVIHYVYNIREAPATVPTVVTTSTTLRFDPAPSCAAAGFVITGPQGITIPLRSGGATGPPESTYEGDATFYITATQDAPGETLTQCSFKGYVDAVSAQVVQTSTTTVTQGITAAYLGLLSVSVPVLIDEAGPQKQINYVMDITNVGNARSNVLFSIDNQDAKAEEGWQAVAPGQLLLESRLQGGTTVTKQANFVVSTPYQNGWNNDETTFVFRLQPVSTNNQDLKGQEVSVNVLARVRGIYVPGPEPMLLLGAIVGAALVARLASQKDD